MEDLLFNPSQKTALVNAENWISAIITGEAVTSLCVLAVAILGFHTLAGRFNLIAGLKTILGIFIILGAPIVASTMLSWRAPSNFSEPPILEPQLEIQAREELPQASNDPYAGASLNRN